MSVAVYQMNAADGRVLYVGQTINLGSRLGTHAAGQPWWEQVATIVVEHCPDREAATALEASRIAELTPEFNRHNVERGPRGDARGPAPRRVGDDPERDLVLETAGACPNVFANLPGTRIGVPRWWVDRLISPPEPPVVVGRGSGGAASPSAAAECGTPTLRTVPGVAAPGAA